MLKIRSSARACEKQNPQTWTAGLRRATLRFPPSLRKGITVHEFPQPNLYHSADAESSAPVADTGTRPSHCGCATANHNAFADWRGRNDLREDSGEAREHLHAARRCRDRLPAVCAARRGDYIQP